MVKKSVVRKTPAAVKKAVSFKKPDLIVDPFHSYLSLMKKHGLLEGAVGKQRLSPAVVPVLDMFHKVLAGARVSSVKTQGSYDKLVVGKCEKILKESLAEANRINIERGSEVAFG